MLSFLFVKEGQLFIKKSSFKEFNLVSFTAECMVCFEMQPRQRSFCWIFRYILHSMAKTITFLKGNLCILKCFIEGLWIKIFKKRLLCLLFWVCSFIKLAQNTIVTTTSKLNLSLNASHIHYTHHFLRRCQVQVLDTFRYAANEFYSKVFFTVYSRLLI